MQGSELRSRITIQSKSVTRDAAYGTEVVTWVAMASRIAANVQDVLPSKAESTTRTLSQSVRPARVRFRYRPGITTDMRIIVHGATERTLNVVSGPAVLGVYEWTEVMAEERTTSGDGV